MSRLFALSTVLAAAPLAMLDSSASAATLVEYTFEDGTAATVASPQLTSSIVSFGTGDNQLANNGVQAGDTKFLAFSQVWQSYQSPHFIQVNVNVAPGYELDLSSLSFTTYNGGGTSGGYSMAAFTSSDAYAWPGVAVVNDTTSGWGGGGVVTTADLSGLPHQNLTGTVSLRFSPFKTHDNDIWGSWQGIDDIRVEGSVSAIPEPASLILAGAGLLLLARRR